VEKLALLFLLCAAFFLRFYCLTCSSFWHDEGNTWALIQRSFAQIAADAAADIHPPGYYWLLKVWSLAFGHTPWALRAFSALTGVLTVAVVYAIGKRVSSEQLSVISQKSSAPQSSIFNLQSSIFAALLAALNPFQIFYSQEARMYSLLMLESAGLVWVVLGEGKRQKGKATGDGGRQTADRSETAGPQFAIRNSQFTIRNSQFTIHNSQFIILFSLLAAAGLWTHYIFPVVLAAIFLGWLLTHRPLTIHHSPFTIHHSSLPFLLANLLALLLFLPWLPTAVDRLLSWPAGGVDVSALDGLRLTLQTLAVGPIRSAPELGWPWLALVGLLPLIGLWRLRANPATLFLALWLLTPIGLMFGLGLFSDSFLKFLLVASPAWCVLSAWCVVRGAYIVSRRDAGTQRGNAATSHFSHFTFHAANVTTYAIRNSQFAIPLAAIVLAYLILPAYYADPAARDNYAGMAATVAGLGDPATDAVILNAPGQADVWRIYDPGVAVLALPQQRPPDQAITEAELDTAVADRRQLFALFWATEQSDPAGIVESWLNRHAFKGLESWQGNVRFVQYSLPNQLACQEFSPPVRFGESIGLTRACLPPERTVVAGTNLPISLHWRTDAPIAHRYKATLQLLNTQNQIIAQQDSEPGGGSAPTDGWLPGAEIVDKRGLYAPPGAPPIAYRLILALYDAETGQRLAVSGSDALALNEVTVTRPSRPLPADILPMRARLDLPIGPVVLAGYDAYAKGYAHDPARPLSAGELLHVTLFWQSPSPLPPEWPTDLHFTLSLGGEQISAPLAGSGFPTGAWRAGDFVRGDVEISYQGDGPVTLSIDGQKVLLGRVKNGHVRY